MKVGSLVEVLSNFNADADVEGQLIVGGFLLDLEQSKKRGPKPGCKRTKPYTGAKRGPKPKNVKKKVKIEKKNSKATKKGTKKPSNKEMKKDTNKPTVAPEKTE